MWRRLSLLMFLAAFFVGKSAAGGGLRIGAVYEGQGKLSVLFDLDPEVPIRPEAIQLLEDGTPIIPAKNVKTFAESDRYVAWVLCIDVSRTMQERHIDEIKSALRAFIGKMRPQDRVALISFADRPRIEARFHDGSAFLEQEISGLALSGKKTVLNDALHEALNLLKNRALPERRRILVISDGKDEGSMRTEESVIALAKKMRVPVDGIGYGRIPKGFAQRLGRFADTTNGYFQSAQTLGLAAAMERVYRNVMSSRIADFSHPTQPFEPLTKTVGLRIELPNTSSMEAAIPYETRHYKLPPPGADETFVRPPLPAASENGVSVWLLALLTLLTILFTLALLFWWRHRQRNDRNPTYRMAPEERISATVEKTEWTPLPEPQAPATGLPTSPPFPSARNEARHTRVGSYMPPPTAKTPAAILVGIGGSEQGREFAVNSESFEIGANSDNDLCILYDEFVSARHATIVFEGGSLLLVDRGSRNGTFVNDVPVGDTSVLLSFGDLIRLGGSEFRLDPGS